MSFGFGGNTSNSTGFGGFGNSNNASSGFGSNNNTSSAGGMFGANNNTATSGGGFGSGGFGGANANSNPFGQKPATTGFGGAATTSGGGGLFGSQTSTSGGFGGGGTTFGANNTSAANTSFGSGNTGGGLFGSAANKPAGGFGTSNATGGSIFGSGNTATGGFGANNNPTSAFGANNTSTGFGGATTSGSTGGFGGFGGSNNTATTNTGTGSTPFQNIVEKDPTSNQSSNFQSITFQQPYITKSFEELRVEDYLQGRRFGNTNGQAGSFGTSTGFGGSVFGNNNTTAATTGGGGLFGGGTSTTNTTSGFGGGFGASNTNTTGGFGNTNTGGGLFGSQNNQPKPGGLFGNTASSGTTTGGFGGTAGSTGGLFGSTNNQSTGFGANNAQQTTGGGLFGSANNAQPKPAFGGFGASNTTTTGFGSNTNAGGGLFGSSTNTTQQNQGGGLFGANNNQQQSTGGGLFGSNNQQGNTAGGLFGSANNNQAKPGGLFGSSTTNTNTGGGLFGSSNNQQQSTGSGLFGSNNQQSNTGGGLFGSTNNNQAKPGGLFGSATANTNTGGGLFGSSTQQNNTGGGSLFGGNNANTGGASLFGGNNPNQNRTAGTGLFGSTTSNANTGGGLFGSNTNQNQQATAGSSLFGSTNQNANSMFSQSNNQQNQQNQLHASLSLSPYGNDQLFSSLGQSAAPIGPLATPLAGAKPTPSKGPSLLSSTRLNSPIYTPRASTVSRNSGYGFTYSTYGTPNSSFSGSLTPQASSLLKPTGSLGSALTSRLAKSMSMNNLRGIDTPTREGDSLLRPTPGSASSRYLEAGKMRRLTVDRNLRTDLFAPPEPKQVESLRAQDGISPGLSKKVSFDNSATGAKQTNAEPHAGTALVRTETSDGEEVSPAASRSKQPHTQEMQQVNGASLTDIPEDGEPSRATSAPGTKRPSEKGQQAPDNGSLGEYYTKPSLKDLRNMSRAQLQNVGNFTVGRDGCGYIEFGKVDLTNVDLDQICGGIVNFRIRSATVYPDNATKPERGKGLNVPSTIHLLNSWPRDRRAAAAKAGPSFDRHVARLHKIKDTEFVNYDADQGVWTFKVQHFTTYGLDEEDESLFPGEDEVMEEAPPESSVLSEPPTTPRHDDDTMQSIETGNGEPDDTFSFKKSSLRGPQLPGGFDEPSENITYDYDDPSADEDMGAHMMSGALGSPEADMGTSKGGAVQAPSPGAYERHHSSMVLDDDSGAVQLAEDPQDDLELDQPEIPGSYDVEEPKLLRSILKPSTGAFATFTSPEKLATDTWEDQLQRTMSPRKRDRQALRNLQQSALRRDRDDIAESPFKRSMLGQSQLGQSYLAQKSAKKVGFHASTLGGMQSELGKSQAFKTSMDIMNSLWDNEKTTRSSAGVGGFENPYPKKLRLTADLDDQEAAFHASVKPKFANDGTLLYSSTSGSAARLSVRQTLTPVVSEHAEIRFVKLVSDDVLSAFKVAGNNTMAVQRQQSSFTGNHGVWPQFVVTDLNFKMDEDLGRTEQEHAVWQLAELLFDPLPETGPEPQLRKATFTSFWRKHVAVQTCDKPEEQALLWLTKGDIIGAAQALLNGGNRHLAMVVAQLPGTAATRQLMQSQIDGWRNRNDWSEMSDAIRALWSIVAGETCVVQGKNGSKEDRVDEFSIAERFGLDWKQSLGLRIYFGGYDDLGKAITAYTEDLASGREVTLPTPWWSTRDNLARNDQEDIMLGLLRVYASAGDESVDLRSVFDSKTVSGSAFDSRVAWQLASNLRYKGFVHLSDETMDALTTAFAAETEWGGDLQTSAYILTHLNDHVSRERAVKALIMRNGRLIADGPLPPYEFKETDERFDYDEEAEILLGCPWVQLVNNGADLGLGIPERLLWESKAQYVATLPDENAPALQVEYLVNAQLYGQAQGVIAEVVGPKAIIEQDYEELERLLNLFPDFVGRDSRGANVYAQFCGLMRLGAQEKASAAGAKAMEELLGGLRRMKGGVRKRKLEEKVAVLEMERVVVREMKDAGHV